MTKTGTSWGSHFSRKRFDERCLEEYSRVFRSVCVDATYYSLPKIKFLTKLGDQAPDGFRLSFKVPEEITIRKFPNLPAFGKRAGRKTSSERGSFQHGISQASGGDPGKGGRFDLRVLSFQRR